MFDLLVRVPVPVHRRTVTGDGNHRRYPQVGILEPCRQVHGAHRLGEAQTRLAGDPGVCVRHVRRRLLAVADNPLDAHVLHLHKGAADDRGNEKHVGYAVIAEGLSEKAGAGHAGHLVASC